jgi:DeoR/GlpR family transcriptional regulator of sugar metabolism
LPNAAVAAALCKIRGELALRINAYFTKSLSRARRFARVRAETGKLMSRPLAVRRHNEILRRVRASGTVSVSELAQAFGVSHETIRRDLKLLAEQGHLDVVHGGAAQLGIMEPSLAQRETENQEGKAAIGRAAAAMVPNGGTVLLDSGSTTAAIAQALVGRSGLTICTNSLVNATLLSHVPGHRVVILGGEVDPNDDATFGLDAMSMVASLRVDLAFIGIGGFADDGCATDYSRINAEFRGRLIMSGRAYLVADRTKLARRTAFRIPHCDKVEGVVLDEAPTTALREAWDRLGYKVVVATA